MAIRTIVDSLNRGETHYVAVPGITPLREAIARFLTELGVDTPIEKIIVGVIPFAVLMILFIVILLIFPQICLYLPSLMKRQQYIHLSRQR